MKITLYGVLTALAAASIAQAIPAPAPEALVGIGKPRYKFPRVGKRDDAVVTVSGTGGITLGDATSRELPSGSPTPPLITPTPSQNDNNPSGSTDPTPTVSNNPSNSGDPSVNSNQQTNSNDANSAGPTATGSADPTDANVTQGATATGTDAAATDTATGTGGLLSKVIESVTSDLLASDQPTASPTITDASPTATGTATDAGTTANNQASETNTGITLGLSSIVSDVVPSITSDILTNIPTQDPLTQTPTLPTDNPLTQTPTLPTDNPLTQTPTLPTDNPLTQTPTLPTDNPITQTPTIPTVGPTNPGTTEQPPTNTDGPTVQPPTNTDGPTAQPPSTTQGPPPTNTDGPTAQPPSTTQGPPPTNTDGPTAQPPTTTGQVSQTPGITGPGTSNTESPNTATGQPSVTSNPATDQAAPSSQPSAVPTSGSESSQLSAGPNSIAPTGTNTNTALLPETSIQSATSSPTEIPQSSASVIPSALPRIIQPNGGVPEAPAKSVLIQLGFTYGLNYPFVVGSSTAVAQIFSYLPAGVSHGIDLTNDKVVMQYLQPYNTLPTLGYITTLAMAYIPEATIDQLSLALLNPNSALYNNPNPSVKTLMGMIDPSIPLRAGTSVAGGSPITSSNGAATTSSNSDSASAAGDGNNSSTSGIRASSVGIGVGVVAGAAVYGAAMFFVARRYKKKKARHQRSSSVLTGSTGSSGSRANEGTDLIAHNRDSYGTRLNSSQSNQPMGGRDTRNSDRSRDTGRNYISPPVMAENSLGWN